MVYQRGTTNYDSLRRELTIGGRYIKLGPKEHDLVRVLMRADGRPVPNAVILDKVWGLERASEMSLTVVTMHVSRLRRKGLTLIENVWGQGYKIRRRGPR